MRSMLVDLIVIRTEFWATISAQDRVTVPCLVNRCQIEAYLAG